MKTVILNGAAALGQNPQADLVHGVVAAAVQAKSWPAVNLDLAAMDIKPCRGCFSCWVKTPGLCVIRDDEETIIRAVAACELLIWLTPITFGGFSPELKKALDRIIPILLPFFIKVHGETHHPLRYPARRHLLVIGTQEKEDPDGESIFRRLAGRNATNMAAVSTTILIINGRADDETLTPHMDRQLSKLEVS
jgi:multimeric flavodoxin WrbA